MVADVMGLMRAVLTVTADRILGSEGRNAEAECCLNIITRQLHHPARTRSQARLQLNRCRCRTFIQMGN